MTEAQPGDEASLFPKTAGERLREAREAMGLSLAEIAARTRVPLRHLEAIEQSDFSQLPSPTYAVGFAKAYARVVGLDEPTIGQMVRASAEFAPRRTPEFQGYEPEDPTRLPPRGLPIIVGALAVILVVAVAIWYSTNGFRGDEAVVATATAPVPAQPVAAAPPAATPATATPAAGGQVSLTATDLVWVRIYDATRPSIHEGEMKPGERYDVPTDIAHPLINVGRPDKLRITVNGSAVPPLGDGSRPLKDIDISAAALLARPPSAPGTGPAVATP